MAATYPSRDPDRSEESSRPRLASAPEAPARRSPMRWIVIGLVVLVVAAAIVYFIAYSGGGGSGGSGAGGGGGGGGYFVLAFPVEAARRFAGRIRDRIR